MAKQIRKGALAWFWSVDEAEPIAVIVDAIGRRPYKGAVCKRVYVTLAYINTHITACDGQILPRNATDPVRPSSEWAKKNLPARRSAKR